jgi:hypothetical protein
MCPTACSKKKKKTSVLKTYGISTGIKDATNFADLCEKGVPHLLRKLSLLGLKEVLLLLLSAG